MSFSIMIKTYIINLPTSINRRHHMMSLLYPYSFLDIEFISAVDGRILTEEQLRVEFNTEESYKRYGRRINGGEIGCTLSHFKCYDKINKLSDTFVLILEDDISIVRNLDKLNLRNISNFMSSKKPRILFLSGDYWHYDREEITRVFSAVGSYAYFINKSAVNKILSNIIKPSNVADDWDVYKQLGVELYAINPYVIDANIADIPSEIKQEYWGNYKNNMSLKYVLRAIYNGFVKRYLDAKGCFESKIRVE